MVGFPTCSLRSGSKQRGAKFEAGKGHPSLTLSLSNLHTSHANLVTQRLCTHTHTLNTQRETERQRGRRGEAVAGPVQCSAPRAGLSSQAAAPTSRPVAPIPEGGAAGPWPRWVGQERPRPAVHSWRGKR